MILFFALCCVGIAIAGLSAFVIFWPLTLIHLRDRHPALSAQFGKGAFLKPDCLRWLLQADFIHFHDSALSGLAHPARLAFIIMCGGLLAALGLGLLS